MLTEDLNVAAGTREGVSRKHESDPQSVQDAFKAAVERELEAERSAPVAQRFSDGFLAGPPRVLRSRAG